MGGEIMRKIFVMMFLSLLVSTIEAQVVSTGTISGKVIEASTGKPIPLANVFITGTTFGASANEQGMFEIKNIPFGDHDLVASMIGYESQFVHIRLTSALKSDIVFRLQQRDIFLPGVEVVAEDPKEWKKNLERFKEIFLGYSSNVSKCTILNPEVLDFRTDPETKLFYATARKPLEIENKALGYRFQYHLREFEAGKVLIKYGGFTKFDELKPEDDAGQKKWEEQRKRAYNGSLQHFLAAVVRGTVEEEGYSVQNISYLWPATGIQQQLGEKAELEKMLGKGDLPFERRFSFSKYLQIVYSKEKPEYGYRRFITSVRNFNGAQNLGLLQRASFDEIQMDSQISVIEMNTPVVVINADGYMSDPFALTTYGYWSYERVADLLPLDYKPKKE